MPRVSVLVPSYGHEAFLGACLASLQAQTFTDWEAVVVDDASPDASRLVAEDAAAQDPRIRVFHNERNQGAYATQVRAAELAQGELLAVLNSDDLWSPGKLASQLAALDESPGAACCATLGWPCDAHGRPTGQDVHADWPTGLVPLAPWLLYENRILASSTLFRRERFVPFPALRYSGDWSALLAAAHRGPLLVLPQRLTMWRQHSANSYVVSPAQAAEEAAWREVVGRQGAVLARGGPAADVAAGLAKNAVNLFALYLLLGQPGRAARLLPRMLQGGDRRAHARRWATLAMGWRRARAHVWRGQPGALEAVPAARARLASLDEADWMAKVTSG
jgi:glycosyltransferase involved in cell wall biosynthesis